MDNNQQAKQDAEDLCKMVDKQDKDFAKQQAFWDEWYGEAAKAIVEYIEANKKAAT